MALPTLHEAGALWTAVGSMLAGCELAEADERAIVAAALYGDELEPTLRDSYAAVLADSDDGRAEAAEGMAALAALRRRFEEVVTPVAVASSPEIADRAHAGS